MRIAVCSFVLVSLLGFPVCASSLASDVDAESSGFLEKAKSADPNVREQAVRDLVGIREAVADELARIVADANAGLDTSTSAAKASALWLMGRWQLVQCADVPETEKNYRRSPTFPSGSPLYEAREGWDERMSRPARGGAKAVALASSGVALRPNRFKADLAIAPVLKKALADLRSRDDSVFSEAEGKVMGWHGLTSFALERALLANNTTLYPDDTKVTLAFLAGELRVTRRDVFLKSVDLQDSTRQVEKYPSAYEVTSPDSDYPCVVGILKSHPLSKVADAVYKLGDRTCSEAGRGRLARALISLNPESVKAEFEKYYRYIQSNPPYRENDNAEVLARLDSVKAIFEQP